MRFKSEVRLHSGAIVLAGLIASCSGLLAQSNFTVRVVAANVSSGNNQRYESAGTNILVGLKPDVVAIQEFNYSSPSGNGINTPNAIREMVDSVFGTNFDYFRESGYSIPNGVISRWPILEGGSWNDTQVTDRGFAWARIDLPGTNDLYVVSVHLHSSGGSSSRATEATNLKSLIQSNFPTNAWVVLCGDFNTDTRTETAMTTFKAFLSDSPIPADQNGNSNTSEPRSKPYDYVLPSFSMTNFLVPVVMPSRTFTNGLVFDSEVYTPLSDVSPVAFGDSHVNGMQHMAVVKDFHFPATGTNAPTAPSISDHPQNQTVAEGSNATFSVTANGAAPLYYQWYFNETNILEGAMNNIYTRTNVVAENAGYYSVMITNVAGSVTSSNAFLTVDGSPRITGQPQSLTVSPGQNATFTVNVEGVAPFSYQWRFGTTNIGGATSNSYTRFNAQPADAGNYSVVITNHEGSVTSQIAVLTVGEDAPLEIIAQWNFNSIVPDGSVATGTNIPSIGYGTASLVGGATATYATGDTSLDPAGSTDNSAWNSTTYPAQNTGNKSRGLRFNVSTAGRQDISVTWSSQASNTGSRYARLQFTTNGADFIDFTSAVTNGTSFSAKSNNLAGFTTINNNSNFGFRLVAEFEDTATGGGIAGFIAANSGSTYGAGGTIRYDMVTILGSAIPTNTPPASPATLSAPSISDGTSFQMTVTGQAGANYAIQVSTNVSGTNWTSIATNVSPFVFTDTNILQFIQRYYRAVSIP